MILNALIAHLGLTKWMLVGHSMGAKFACALAARRPVQALRELILVAPSPPTLGADERRRPHKPAGRVGQRRRRAQIAAYKITAQPLETKGDRDGHRRQPARLAVGVGCLARHGQPGRRFSALMGEIDVPVWVACRRRGQKHHVRIWFSGRFCSGSRTGA